jgi:hypothetical protein
MLNKIPEQPQIVIFNGGPKDGQTIPYKLCMCPEYKVVDQQAYSIGNWYTDSSPLPFEDIKWVRYVMKKAVRQFFVPYKKIEINPANFKDRYTVKVYQDYHIDMAYVYQLEGSNDKPNVPEEAWFGRRTKTELLDCFQNNNDEAYLDWLQEEEALRKILGDKHA